MNKKGAIVLVIVIIVLIIIIAIASTNSYKAPVGTQGDYVPPVTTDTTVTTPTATTSMATSTIATTTVVVTYTNAGFSPKNIIIHNGDTVTFKNASSQPFWPASNDHPTHLIYPQFDPKKAIPAGQEWSFTFTRVGTWGYHNHRSPTMMGTVTVQ